MSFVCLSIRNWATAAESSAQNNADNAGTAKSIANSTLRLSTALMHVSPHICEKGGLVWIDARGLSISHVAREVLAIAIHHAGDNVRVGAARTAIAAEIAACADTGTPDRTVLVPPGNDREFLAPFPLSVLEPHANAPRLLPMLADVGIESCGDLARLTGEAMEVRFGADAVALWKLARADDSRLLFPPRRRALPSASIEWEEYVLRDVERLLFVANNLTITVCAELRAWGETARALTLAFRLANGTSMECCIHAATATASKTTWLRLIRTELERTTLPDAVTGISLRIDAASALETPQGDLFDAGFQSARAVESAVASLLDDKRATIAGLTTTSHPLVERRATWSARTVSEALRTNEKRPPMSARLSAVVKETASTLLSLQLWPKPRQVTVTTQPRRGCDVPVSYREQRGAANPPAPGDVELLVTTGPDCISSDDVGMPYSREYFHGLTHDGTLVLMYRDVTHGGWYLHGWWD
ncbi:MAG: hypothetical protein ABJE47_22610 [bacterium]